MFWACTGDRGVDADDLAGHVQQRAAGVAGVDRGVGLDHVGEGDAVLLVERAAGGRHDAGRHRRAAGQVEGVADGDELVADLRGSELEPSGSGVRPVRSTLSTARSLLRVGGDDLGLDRRAVVEVDGDVGGAVDDVVVGDDVAVGA